MAPLSAVPTELACCGSEKGWANLVAFLSSSSGCRQCVLWGPVGCGKSHGVSLIAKRMGYHIMALDGADGEGPTELVGWVAASRRVKANTEGMANLVVLDDFEGFTEPAREAVLKHASPRRAGGSAESCLAPLVIICTNLREAAMIKLYKMTTPPTNPALKSIRLFSPNVGQMEELFRKHYLFPHPTDPTTRYSPPGIAAAIAQERHVAETGDIRRMANALTWRIHYSNDIVFTRAERAEGRFYSSRFEACRLLLLRRTPWDNFVRHASLSDAYLLAHHIPGHVNNDMDSASDVLATFSDCFATSPFRLTDMHSQHQEMQLCVAAIAARVHSRAQDVGALYPPPDLHPRPEAGTSRSGPFRTFPSETPKLLLDRG